MSIKRFTISINKQKFVYKKNMIDNLGFKILTAAITQFYEMELSVTFVL